jgi:hypothetical protein
VHSSKRGRQSAYCGIIKRSASNQWQKNLVSKVEHSDAIIPKMSEKRGGKARI